MKLEEGSRLADAVYRDTVLDRKGGEGEDGELLRI